METSWTLDPDEGSSLFAKLQKDEIVVNAEKRNRMRLCPLSISVSYLIGLIGFLS